MKLNYVVQQSIEHQAHFTTEGIEILFYGSLKQRLKIDINEMIKYYSVRIVRQNLNNLLRCFRESFNIHKFIIWPVFI